MSKESKPGIYLFTERWILAHPAGEDVRLTRCNIDRYAHETVQNDSIPRAFITGVYSSAYVFANQSLLEARNSPDLRVLSGLRRYWLRHFLLGKTQGRLSVEKSRLFLESPKTPIEIQMLSYRITGEVISLDPEVELYISRSNPDTDNLILSMGDSVRKLSLQLLVSAELNGEILFGKLPSARLPKDHFGVRHSNVVDWQPSQGLPMGQDPIRIIAQDFSGNAVSKEIYADSPIPTDRLADGRFAHEQLHQTMPKFPLCHPENPSYIMNPHPAPKPVPAPDEQTAQELGRFQIVEVK